MILFVMISHKRYLFTPLEHAKCQQTGARFNVYVVACDESGDLAGRRQERQFKLRLTTNQLNL